MKNGVRNIQAAAYNGARTVNKSFFRYINQQLKDNYQMSAKGFCCCRNFKREETIWPLLFLNCGTGSGAYVKLAKRNVHFLQ